MKFVRDQWNELGPSLFLVTLFLVLIQALGTGLTIHVIFKAWGSKPWVDLFFMSALLAAANVLCFLVWMKKPRQMNPIEIPQEALTVGPNYMKIWSDGGRVHLVFRNMPMAKVSFDKRVVPELSQKLGEL